MCGVPSLDAVGGKGVTFMLKYVHALILFLLLACWVGILVILVKATGKRLRKF